MKLDGFELFKFISKNIKTNKIKRNNNNKLEIEDLENNDLFDIIFNTKKFLMNVWELSLTNGIKKEIEINLNNINIQDLFLILFKNKEDFLNSYIFYKNRKKIQNKLLIYFKEEIN